MSTGKLGMQNPSSPAKTKGGKGGNKGKRVSQEILLLSLYHQCQNKEASRKELNKLSFFRLSLSSPSHSLPLPLRIWEKKELEMREAVHLAL